MSSRQVQAIEWYDRRVLSPCIALIIAGVMAFTVALTIALIPIDLAPIFAPRPFVAAAFAISLITLMFLGGGAALVAWHKPFRPLEEGELTYLARLAREDSSVRAYLTNASAGQKVLRVSLMNGADRIHTSNLRKKWDREYADDTTKAEQDLANALGGGCELREAASRCSAAEVNARREAASAAGQTPGDRS